VAKRIKFTVTKWIDPDFTNYTKDMTYLDEDLTTLEEIAEYEKNQYDEGADSVDDILGWDDENYDVEFAVVEDPNYTPEVGDPQPGNYQL